MSLKKFSSDDVNHVSKLAQIPIAEKEVKELIIGFNEVLKAIDKLSELNTRKTIPTSQVTGLSNVFRKDKVDKSTMLTQNQALKNARETYKGYFVVKRIIDIA